VKLNAELTGQNHEVTIRCEDQRVFAAVDGRQYELELRETNAAEYLLLENNRVYGCRVVKSREQRDSFAVNVGTHSYAIRVTDPKRLRSAQSSGGHDHGAAQVLAPMPGKVVRVLVEVGAQVEAGAGVVVVEAMKMQNELKSPKAGTVVAINAKVGSTVNAADVLAIIE
jgi:biotin carboxyl carrier protein